MGVEIGPRALGARNGRVEQRALLGARDVRTHSGGDIEFIECAQHGGARRASLVTGCDEMRLRRLGRTAPVLEFEQQVELDIAALIFGFRQRLQVVRGCEMGRRLAQRRYRCAPRCRVRACDELVAFPERHVTEQAFIDGRIRRRPRPAQDAHRGGATPGALIDARHRDAHRGRLFQANYRAVEAVPEVRIGEFGVLLAGVDLDAHVDVALADLDDVDARPQLADQRLGRRRPGRSVRSSIRPAVRSRIRPSTPKGTGTRAMHMVRNQHALGVFLCSAVALVRTRILASPLPSDANVYRHLRCAAITNRKCRQGL